ncbi:MAG: glycosyltransferase [Candidatus Bathyarchaeia archaeon]
MAKKILILAGGGGHTGYAYALAQNLYGRANLSFLVPKGDLLSQKRLSRFGEVHSAIKPRGPKTPHHEFIPRLIKAFPDSLKNISSEYDVIVSTGSNFCVPPSIIAWLKGIPIVNIESSVRFIKPSKTAFLLQPIAALTALQWEEQKKILKKGKVVGPLIPKPEVEPRNEGYILVTGGTEGHKMLFDAIVKSNLKNIVMQTGKIDPEPYKKIHPEWKVINYSTEFHRLIAGAEVVVTHFGMTALETLIYRKPTVIVPNPEWTRTATIEDAKYYARKVNAVLVTEITPENILNAIKEAKEKEQPKLPDGAKNLADLIIKL